LTTNQEVLVQVTQQEARVSAQIIDFAEAKAAMLRKADTPLGRMFRELEGGSKMENISTEQLIQWATRLNTAKDSDTMAKICKDIEEMLEGNVSA
jgi:hypothetical protein